jgi:hypothetical protein
MRAKELESPCGNQRERAVRFETGTGRQYPRNRLTAPIRHGSAHRASYAMNKDLLSESFLR